MLAAVLSIIFLLLFIYIFILAGWIDEWLHGTIFPELKDQKKGVSVIVPFRNERDAFKKHLKFLLDELNDLDGVELIFVNDHSDDGGQKLIQPYLSESIRLHHATGMGKKNAVREGVHLARYDYILTLDADIAVPVGWLQTIRELTAASAELVILPLEVKPNERSFGSLQEMEFLSLYAVTGATAMKGYPMMCNGAHLLFSKEYYLRNEHALKHHVSSGDDMFLMEAAQLSDRIIYANRQEIVASMEPEFTLRSFIRQRIRWSGKTLHLKSKGTIAFGMLVVALQCSFWLLLFAGFIHTWIFVLLGVFWTLKSIIDLMLMNAASSRTGRHFSLYYCLLLALVYPLYGLIIPLLGIVIRPKWKGRVINT